MKFPIHVFVHRHKRKQNERLTTKQSKFQTHFFNLDSRRFIFTRTEENFLNVTRDEVLTSVIYFASRLRLQLFVITATYKLHLFQGGYAVSQLGIYLRRMML